MVNICWISWNIKLMFLLVSSMLSNCNMYENHYLIGKLGFNYEH